MLFSLGLRGANCVAGVTVSMKYNEQSAAPSLFGNAKALTAKLI